MSQIEFEDQKNIQIRDTLQISSGRSSILSKLHFVKSEEEEQKILIIFSIILLLISMYLYWQYTYLNTNKEISYSLSKEVIQKLPIEIQEKIILR